jgi:hypothetical protein
MKDKAPVPRQGYSAIRALVRNAASHNAAIDACTRAIASGTVARTESSPLRQNRAIECSGLERSPLDANTGGKSDDEARHHARFGLLLAVAPAGAAPKVKDQTVATWTTNAGTPDNPKRWEYSLVVHGGVLERQEVDYCKGYVGVCPPQGRKRSMSIKLSNVKAFEADTLEGETFEGQVMPTVYRIGLKARGDHDMLDKGPSGTYHNGGIPGFAVFPADQKALRDETYKKLCEMIGQTP